MAVLKERLNRKNTLGGYDTIYLETSSDLITRPDGSTVESSLVTINQNITEVTTKVENVTNNVTNQVQTIIQQGNAKHASSHASTGTDPITPASIGALATGGTAAAATKLAIARTFQVNLSSTASITFDGSANVTPGVTGTLGLANGGTGKTTAPLGIYNLINGCTELTDTTIVDTDMIPVGDVSAATGKKISVANLKKIMASAGNAAIVESLPTTPGNVVTWGGHNWTVVHVTTDYIYLILTQIYSTTTFGSTTRYSQSNLVNLCNTFLGTIDSKYQDVLQPMTIYGVTSKVFVPTHGMVSNNSPAPYSGSDGTNNYSASSGAYGDGTTAFPCFSWFNAAYNTNYANRIAYYNGTATAWWTATAYSSGSVWDVNANGNANNVNYPTHTIGFRPCVAVKRR